MAEKTPVFEKQMERLRKIVESLEAGDLSLDKGVSLYKEGLALAGSCRKQLENARHEVLIMNDGNLEAFRTGNDPADDFESKPENDEEDKA